MADLDSGFEEPMDEIVSLNLVISRKNKKIQEDEIKLNELDSLVDSLMKQIKRFKVQENKLNYELSQSKRMIYKLKSENRDLELEEVSQSQLNRTKKKTEYVVKKEEGERSRIIDCL